MLLKLCFNLITFVIITTHIFKINKLIGQHIRSQRPTLTTAFIVAYNSTQHTH
jgi:hypothetical protein